MNTKQPTKQHFPWQMREAAQNRVKNYGIVLPATFWNKFVQVKDPTECWPFIGTIDPNSGYGRMGFDYRYEVAHRLAYTFTYGDIPEELCVLHTCDFRGCCNPLHLFLGTYLDNNRDRAQKGRNGPKHGEFNGRAKLTEDIVKQIRSQYAGGFRTLPQLAEDYDITKNAVRYIVIRKTWGHVD